MNSAHLNLRPVVLLVEDEPVLRFFASDVLDDAGFAVIETGNADEALTWLEGRDDVRVIFTDIQMPGRLNGLDLAALVHRRWPGILILVVSGDVRPSRAELPEGGALRRQALREQYCDPPPPRDARLCVVTQS
jgi:two-component system, response regulator PdtaR